MLQIYYTDENNQLLSLDVENGVENVDLTGKWINLSNPTDKEIELVSRVTALPEDYIKAALDEEERARIEVEDGNLLTLFDIPVMEDDEGSDYYTYSTLPFAFISNQKTVVTVCLKENIITQNFIMNRVKSFATYKRTRFLLQLMYVSSTKFLQYLRQIDKTSTRIQAELNKSMKNKELITELANRMDWTSKEVSDMLSALSSVVSSKLVDNDTIYLQGFGQFEVKKKAERISVNPANGKRYLVPPKLVPVFKPGTTVKNRLKELGDHE